MIGKIFAGLGTGFLISGVIASAVIYLDLFDRGLTTIGAPSWGAVYFLACLAFSLVMLALSSVARKHWRYCLAFLFAFMSVVCIGISGLLVADSPHLDLQRKMLAGMAEGIALVMLYGVPGVVATIYAAFFYSEIRKQNKTA